MNVNLSLADRALKYLCLLVILAGFTAISFRSIEAQESKEEARKKNQQCGDCCEKCRNEHLLTCPTAPILVITFDYLSTHEWEMGQIDKLLTQMQNNPNADGIIVVYGGRINKRGEFEVRTKRIKDYIDYRNFEISRIKIVHGGFREKFEFELWLSPIEGSFPPLTPTISPEKIKFIGKMKQISL